MRDRDVVRRTFIGVVYTMVPVDDARMVKDGVGRRFGILILCSPSQLARVVLSGGRPRKEWIDETGKGMA
jgi:hypothetical protein